MCIRDRVKSRTIKGYYKNGAIKLSTTVKTSHDEFDLIALIVFDKDGTFHSHYEITKEYFNSVSSHDPHDNIWIMPNTQTQWDNYERKS